MTDGESPLSKAPKERHHRAMLTIIIPTLNAAESLARCLAAVNQSQIPTGDGTPWQSVRVVVVDGGSVDQTPQIAQQAGAEVIVCPKGRGRQLAAGARAAGDTGWLLFLHADSLLPPQWWQSAQDHCRTHPTYSAFFHLSFDEDSPAARRVAWLANWRSRWLGLPYGDQGLLCPQGTYAAVGGCRADLPLMEDVDLVRRLRQNGGLSALPGAVITCAERYQRGGWWRRPLRNLVCLALYFLGVSPEWLSEWYAKR